MNEKVRAAYEYLTPKDQLIADCVIIALYEKSKQNEQMARKMMQYLENNKCCSNDSKSTDVTG